jgi:hypothetical protein
VTESKVPKSKLVLFSASERRRFSTLLKPALKVLASETLNALRAVIEALVIESVSVPVYVVKSHIVC